MEFMELMKWSLRNGINGMNGIECNINVVTQPYLLKLKKLKTKFSGTFMKLNMESIRNQYGIHVVELAERNEWSIDEVLMEYLMQ